MSSTRSLSPWWALLLVPVALAAGQLIGRIPAAPRADNSVAHVAPDAAGLRAIDRAAAGAQSQAAGASSSPHADLPPAAATLPPTRTQNRAEGLRWRTPSDAVEESRQTGKPILLDFNADWCGPCQALKHEVFESPSHGGAIAAVVIPVSVTDRMREEGSNPPDLEALQQRYAVRAFPTLVVMNPSTGKAVRFEGYGGADQAEAWITQAAQAVR